MPEKKTTEALMAYQKLFPHFQFPNDFPEEDMLQAIQKSRGRRIIVSKVNENFKVFYEDIGEDQVEIPKLNKLIGCGG